MAHPKRKRIPARNTSKKRPRYTQPDTSSSSCSSDSDSDSEQTEKNSQEEWEALRILAQTGRGFGLRYLIEWAGIDPATEKQWEPSWVKATNASEGLRTVWRREQAQEAQEKKEAVTTAKRRLEQQSAHVISHTQGAQAQGGTQEKIAESTGTPSLLSKEDVPVEARQSIAAAQSSATLDFGASASDQASPQFAIDAHGESSNRGQYELLSEISESQPSSSRSVTEESDLESSQFFASQPAFRATGVVRGTPSSAGDASYIPVTQEDLESSICSELSDQSGDQIVDYSGLLTANEPPTLIVRAQSPATSIAETVADSTQDVLNHRYIESQQAQSEIAETSVSFAEYGSTSPQDDLSHHQKTGLAHTDSHVPTQEQQQQSSWQIPGDFESARERLLPREHTTHPTVSSKESITELLAVAETPQISQLTAEGQEVATQDRFPHFTQQTQATQLSTEQVIQLSLTERTVWEENAQFAFHSQHPASFGPRSATKSNQRAPTEPRGIHNSRQVEVARLSEASLSEFCLKSISCDNSEESTTIDEISQPLRQKESHPSLDTLHASQPFYVQGSEGGFDSAVIRNGESTVCPTSAVVRSRRLPSTKESTRWCEHNTKHVHSIVFLPTYGDFEPICPNTEFDQRYETSSKHGSSCSRHDSSQESPERHLQSAEHSPSPIPHPPSYSLRTLDSSVPPRPITPVFASSLSKMADNTAESAAEQVGRRLEELKAIHAANNPYVPRRRARVPQASLGPSMVPNPPSINVSAEGTRSPSTVPDRSPAPTMQTSLRTVAFANAKDKATESLLENPLAATSMSIDAGPTKEKAELVAAVAAGVANPHPEASTELPAGGNIEEMDEGDYDDEESVFEDEFNDNLHLEKDEYIVPLFIDGRQKDTYTSKLQQEIDLLNLFLKVDTFSENPASEKLDEAEKVLAYLKNVEDHPDLTYAEAESATDFEMRSAADVQHGAQFGIDNSIKFKFLGELFNRLRKRNMHIVLLLDHDNSALINILRTFLAAAAHNYEIPTKGLQSNASNDTLKITVLPSNVSSIIQPASLVVCLNGVQSAIQIRQRDWAIASGKAIPVLHLVIPQTIGHIERYLPTDKPRMSCIEMIFTVLGQIEARNEVGNAIYIDTPSAVEAAQSVASWLSHDDDQQDSIEWPLPSIGNAPDFMDFDATQQSVKSIASSPAPERTKRPLETDDSDPAKRIRYTSQTHAVSNSSIVQEPDVTRISDSMPASAAAENARLATSLAGLKSELFNVQRERREEQIQWNKQQTEHENRHQQYRKLFNEKAEVDRAVESMTRSRDKIRSQLDVQASELRTLREELDAQRNLGLASPDKKVAEITQLRMELEAAKIERDKALNSEKSNGEIHEYTKEQYQIASNVIGQLRSENEALEAQNKKLAHEASGQYVRGKQLFLDKSMKEAIKQNEILKKELENHKTLLKQMQEELNRVKNNSGRAAYGTRAQSTTPQPKTRSRAASPERGARAPRGGGRISTLVAEER
ncbi:hypothetical protein SVAN01_05878 [Stagonosporopsis vannaccii]|nr:hypothetical protein SVAN01_05878 [Stagonosporopsis vannaccii]